MPLEADAALGPFLPAVASLNVSDETAATLKPGDIIEARIRIRVVAITNVPIPPGVAEQC